MQRRKTLLNGLANNGIASKEILKKMLQDLQLDENTRGETLNLNEFAKISDYLTNQ
jgi:16S rRNA (adenine1518-N6/adenine1519-N6)-dimethyltransferase